MKLFPTFFFLLHLPDKAYGNNCAKNKNKRKCWAKEEDDEERKKKRRVFQTSCQFLGTLALLCWLQRSWLEGWTVDFGNARGTHATAKPDLPKTKWYSFIASSRWTIVFVAASRLQTNLSPFSCRRFFLFLPKRFFSHCFKHKGRCRKCALSNFATYSHRIFWSVWNWYLTINTFLTAAALDRCSSPNADFGKEQLSIPKTR